MALQKAFKRLTIGQTSLCRHCHRPFASLARQEQELRSATAAFADNLQASRNTETNGNATQPSYSMGKSAPFSSPSPVSRTSSTSSSSSLAASKKYELASRLVRDSAAARQKAVRDTALADLQRSYTRKDLEGQQSRRWRVGDVYSPHDLSGIEAAKWKKIRRKPRPGRGQMDVLDQLGIDPLKEYKNFSMMAEYVTEMGRIRHGSETGLRPVNQRRMAKAIRRAVGVGLMPSVYRHPEILRIENRGRQGWS